MTAETKSTEVKAETKAKPTTAKAKNKTAGKKKANKPVEKVFSGELTLQRAAEIKEEFVAAVTAKQDIALFFKDVGDVDLSFVQILCAAQRSAERVGMEISYPGAWPEAFVALVNDSGFGQHVGCHSGCSVECPWIKQKLN